MVKYSLKGTKTFQYYIPKPVREDWGNPMELEMLVSGRVGVVFPPDVDLRYVLDSLDVIICDVKNRIKWEDAGKTVPQGE